MKDFYMFKSGISFFSSEVGYLILWQRRRVLFKDIAIHNILEGPYLLLQSQLPLFREGVTRDELFKELFLVYHLKTKILELLNVELFVGGDDTGVYFENFGLAVYFQDIADDGLIEVNFNDGVNVPQHYLQIIDQFVCLFPWHLELVALQLLPLGLIPVKDYVRIRAYSLAHHQKNLVKDQIQTMRQVPLCVDSQEILLVAAFIRRPHPRHVSVALDSGSNDCLEHHLELATTNHQSLHEVVPSLLGQQLVQITIKIPKHKHRESSLLSLGNQVFSRIENKVKQFCKSFGDQVLIIKNVRQELCQCLHKHFINVKLGKDAWGQGNFRSRLGEFSISSQLSYVCQLQMQLMVLSGRLHVVYVVQVLIKLLVQVWNYGYFLALQQPGVGDSQLQWLYLLLLYHTYDQFHAAQVLKIQSRNRMLRNHPVLQSSHLVEVFLENTLPEVFHWKHLEEPVNQLWVSPDFEGRKSEEYFQAIVVFEGDHGIVFWELTEHQFAGQQLHFIVLMGITCLVLEELISILLQKRFFGIWFLDQIQVDVYQKQSLCNVSLSCALSYAI